MIEYLFELAKHKNMHNGVKLHISTTFQLTNSNVLA